MHIRFGFRSLLGSMLCCLSFASLAAPTLWQLETRRTEDDKPVTLPVLVELPADTPRAVLIALDAGNNKAILKQGEAGPDYGQPTTLITRNRLLLNERGIAVLLPAPPSDRPDGLDRIWREGNEHRQDIKALIAEARKRFGPDTPIVIHGYFAGAISALHLAMARLDGVSGYVLTSGELAWQREEKLERIRTRGIVYQPLSHRCDSIPTPEAREIASRARWQFIEVGDSRVDNTPTCSTSSRAGLAGLDSAFVEHLSRWILGDAVAPTLGISPARLAYSEDVFMVPGATRGLLGKQAIEVSLFTPPGKGPFPLVIFNHGDVEAGPALDRKLRFRDMHMTNEFLALGFAVAQPARPGVGRSEGMYKRFSGAGGYYIGPATGLLEKGREHLAEGLAALEFLRTLPQIDGERIVMSGQSAGGFAVSSLGLDNPPPAWLKAIVNFSGGRTDIGSNSTARGVNDGMVSAFGLLGKTSRVPSLWIFAENDSRYTAETIRASYDAFRAAGGVARLELYPPSRNDGHLVFHEPEKWRAALRSFMEQNGLVKPLPPPTAASQSGPVISQGL